MCCGYPDKLDTDEYLKAPKTNYNLLAPKIDSLRFDEVSIEDAEAKNDLSLLALFKNTKVNKTINYFLRLQSHCMQFQRSIEADAYYQYAKSFCS